MRFALGFIFLTNLFTSFLAQAAPETASASVIKEICENAHKEADGPCKIINPSIYYTPIYNYDRNIKCAGGRPTQTIYNENETPLMNLCSEAIANCKLQGSCLLVKNRTAYILKYLSHFPGNLFSLTQDKECPHGRGSAGYCIDPYFSVAADLKYNDIGTVIYIPEVNGTLLPDGKIHDGFFIVRDKGPLVQGSDRFDFHTGPLNHLDDGNPFKEIGLGAKTRKKIPYIKVTSQDIIQKIYQKRNYPGIPID